ncbi:MAG: type II toxin-antitoxin system HicB family antitoxin [Cytophagales bacterium]
MKKTSKKYQVLIEKTDTGFSAMVMDLPVFTTGTSIENLSSNIIEALNLYLEERNEFVDFGNIKLNMDFQLFFQNYKILNVKFLAKRIGINASLLSQYVRGIKSPSQKQISKILNGINEVGEELKDLALINNFTLKKK